EPEIYATTRMFGTVLENVVMNPNTRELDFSDATLAENTRACYPIGYIPNASKSGMGGQPKNVVMLTYDAFGVLPPIARLTPAQAAYFFLSGYTAKVAGTEIGVKEPQATFSTCFGAPGVPGSVLIPRETWSDKAAYDEKARHLAKLFNENFKQFADQASAEVLAAAPKAG